MITFRWKPQTCRDNIRFEDITQNMNKNTAFGLAKGNELTFNDRLKRTFGQKNASAKENQEHQSSHIAETMRGLQ